MSNSATGLNGAWRMVTSKEEPEPTRKEMRDVLIRYMNDVLPRVVNDWQGWPGTWLLAETALEVFKYKKDGT